MTAIGLREPLGTDPISAASIMYLIDLGDLHESSLNPRSRYDDRALQELAASLLSSGQLTPIIVRPRPAGGYEIAAGHRRYRAAKLASQKSPDGAKYRGLNRLLAVVRELDDKTFIEILNIENLQRDDLHPLEEAAGFKQLMEKAGYDVAKIASRIGRSTKYVYDRVKLLQLVPEAKKLFLDGAFEAGHAIILARLAPADQKRALDPDRSGNGRIGGVFYPEHFHSDPTLPAQEQLKLEDAVKPVSVRELQTWVDDNVRMTPERIDPFLFPETAQQLAAAKDHELKVVHITHDYRVPDAARDEKQRTYGEHAWKLADGTHKSKACDYAVLGVVVAGPGAGEAFRVCVRKDKCKIHWAAEQRELERRRKSGTTNTRATQQSRDQEHERYRREQAARDAERKRWEQAHSAILKAVAEKIAKAPAGATSQLAKDVLNACVERGKPNGAVPRGRTLEDLIRHAAFQLYVIDVRRLTPGYYGHDEARKNLHALGINAQQIVDQVAPKPKPAVQTSAAKPKAKRKAAR